jgi:hypothetical protein
MFFFASDWFIRPSLEIPSAWTGSRSTGAFLEARPPAVLALDQENRSRRLSDVPRIGIVELMHLKAPRRSALYTSQQENSDDVWN